MTMRKKTFPNVERWRDRHGRVRHYYRRGKGPRTPLPGLPGSPEFLEAYRFALSSAPPPRSARRDGTLEALIDDYQRSSAYRSLRATTKAGYRTTLNTLRSKHGHRSVAGMTREGIEKYVLAPYEGRPGAALAAIKILRVIIQHAIATKRLDHDPSAGIKRPKGREIRAWTEPEVLQFETRWPVGTKQRLAFAIMLHAGAARIDVHQITWQQLAGGGVSYERHKTGVEIYLTAHSELQKVLAAAPHDHVCVLTTAFGRPFTVSGFGNFLRAAIAAAGLPLECQPHGLRKTLGRRMAEAGCTAHEIMAALGHKSLTEAERYTRDADRRRSGRSAVVKLEAHTANKNAQTGSASLGNAEIK